mgnify:CR=1 FL=1
MRIDDVTGVGGPLAGILAALRWRPDANWIIAACDLPEDMVYRMVKAMAANIADMSASNKAIAGLTPKIMAEDIGVPLHKGAAKFYKEAGAI